MAVWGSLLSGRMMIKNSAGFLMLFCGLICNYFLANASSKCEPIRIRLCQSMPYNSTQFPNLLHHSTQTNANLYLEQFLPLVELNCSDSLVFYLCSICVPVCPIRFGHEVIPPCRAVCQAVRNGCEPVLARYNITWPSELNCNDLPKHETGVCISPEAIDHSPYSSVNTSSESDTFDRTKPERAENDCNCRKRARQPSPRRAYMKRDFDYVIRGSYLRSKRISENLMTIHFRVTQVLEHSRTPILPHRTIGLWTENQCVCQRFVKGNQYLVMGFEDRGKKMLTFDDKTIVEPWKKNWPKYIKKWKSRIRKRRQQKQQQNNSQTTTTERPHTTATKTTAG